MSTRVGLVERLQNGETILCAEGYLLELSRRGYVMHGSWVPEFILNQPHVLKNLHYEFVHAGTDVIEAFQYCAHREKMKEIGREEDLEAINRAALRIAREVAHDTNKLFAGGICNTNIYKKGETEAEVRAMFDEQVRWSKEEGVDYMIAETISYYGEAAIALDVIKSYDLPAVITMTVITRASDGSLKTLDGVEIGQACLKLLDQGATLVGVNCFRGLDATFEVVKDIVKVCPPDKVAALPLYSNNIFVYMIEQLDLPLSDENHGRSELVQWKTISVSEVINSQFESVQIFNTVDRSNRYFTASFKYNQTIQWNAIICITADYPTSTPLMVVQVDPSHPILHESYNIQLKNVEGYVNVYYPSTVPSSANDDILIKQMLKL